MTTVDWMIYGANGYTGELAARLAVARGEKPILAGRSESTVVRLARALELPHRIFGLDDPRATRDGLAGVDVVAHCAGPFNATAEPMVDACLATGTHYLDVNGDIGVFEAVFARDRHARDAGVVLLPGAGFDVVPTDCLAVALATAVPGATTLELAFLVGGGMSRGTARSTLHGMAGGNLRRVDGVLVPVPFGVPSRVVPLPRSGPTELGAVRWGDLATAYVSTGVPNITAYTKLPAQHPVARPVRTAVTRLMRVGPLRRAASALVDKLAPGPDDATRAGSICEVWAEVRDDAGTVCTATMVGPNAYDLTADSVVRSVAYLRAGTGPAGPVAPGAHTPGTAFGSGYLALLDGVTVNI